LLSGFKSIPDNMLSVKALVDTSVESLNRAIVGAFVFAERKRIATIEQPHTNYLIRTEQLVILDF
jgi:hypothetical protein